MKELEKSMETHDVYVDVFDVCPHKLLCKRQRDVRILRMYAETMTHRRYGLWNSPSKLSKGL
jgi:hypothetical protein